MYRGLNVQWVSDVRTGGSMCVLGVRRVYRGSDVCTGGPTCVPGVRHVYRGFDVCFKRIHAASIYSTG